MNTEYIKIIDLLNIIDEHYISMVNRFKRYPHYKITRTKFEHREKILKSYRKFECSPTEHMTGNEFIDKIKCQTWYNDRDIDFHPV